MFKKCNSHVYMFITVTLNYLNTECAKATDLFLQFTLDVLLTFILMFTPGLIDSALYCHNYYHMLTRLEVQQNGQYTTVIVEM